MWDLVIMPAIALVLGAFIPYGVTKVWDTWRNIAAPYDQ